MTAIAAVAIGRNEGARLRDCLTSLQAQVGRVVYVDSGSGDGSPDLARSLGVEVVELDPATPFSAARGRNAGVEALRAGGLPDLIQFVDGDCTLVPGWIEVGVAALDADPGLALVTGWRTEEHPRANAFHAMVEIEWHRPAGPIDACGGDMLVRSVVFDDIGGFNAALVASEDEDFVQRLRKAGHGALRLPVAMTRHDIEMTRFGQWWRRHLRSGQGFAEVGGIHPPHFAAERYRAWLWGAMLPGAFVLSLGLRFWGVAALIVVLYAANLVRQWRWLRREGLPRDLALRTAALFVAVKLPQAAGMARFHLRGGRRAPVRIIEYRGPGA
ncbi:MAG: glycosyltransferase [Rubellimicrobium sp.]|nr:glycosyltransferase [Rubellimicrobium sp.]